MIHRLLGLTILLGSIALCGCAPELQTEYGARSGPTAELSVNGTSVLSRMFEQAGHRVSSWRMLSPRLGRADCIVWFPDDFEPPEPRVQRWLEDWLLARPGRTLIYVGRDYDAEPLYWSTIQPEAPDDQQAEVKRRLRVAENAFRSARFSGPDEDCGWFTLEGQYRPQKVQTLSGEPGWTSGIDAGKLDIELAGRLLPGDAADVVLSSQGEMLVSREEYDGSQLIVVTNGSFLLNLPLVNHEHRKLAANLIDEIGPPGQNVVFLESGPTGPPIRDEDPDAQLPSGLEILVTRPYLWVFLQLLVVAAVFCVARWPIFGLPRSLERESPSDFGRHIRALAELLRYTQDRGYAMTRLLHYRQTTGERK